MAGPGGKEVGRLNLKVLPDTTQFGRSLQRYVQRIERQVTVRLNVEIDQGSATRELRELQTRLDIQRPNVNIDTDLEGQMAVRAAMLALLAELKAMARAGRPSINPNFSQIGAATAAVGNLTSALGSSASGSGHVGRQIALWGPLIFAAAVGIAAIGPALAALLPLAAGLAAGVAVVALGFEQLKTLADPIKEAFSGMRQEIGNVLTAGLMPLIQAFASDFLPVLRDGLVGIAGLLNDAASNLLEFLNSGDGLALMGEFMSALTTAMAPLTGLLAPLTEVFLRLSTQAAPALEMMNEAIVRVTENLAGWLSSTDTSTVISESMADLGQILVEIGQLVRDLFVPLFAAAPAVIAMLDGIGEVLGAVFLALTPVFEFMSRHTTVVKVLAGAFAGIAIAVAAVMAVGAVVGLVFASTASIIGAAIGAIIGAIIICYNEFETFRNIVHWVINAVIVVAKALWSALVYTFNAVLAPLQSLWQAFQVLWSIAQAVFPYVAALIAAHIAIVTAVFRTVWSVARTVFTAMGRVVAVQIGIAVAAFQLVRKIVSTVFTFIANHVKRQIAIGVAALRAIGAVITQVVGFFGRLRSGISSRVSSAISFVRGIPGKIKSALGSLGSLLLNAGKDIIRGLIRGIESMIGTVTSKLKGLTDKIPDWKGPMSRDRVLLLPTGVAIMDGLITGIASREDALRSELESVTGLIAGVTVPGLEVPSLSFGSGALDELADYAAFARGLATTVGLDDGFGDERLEFVFRDWETGRGHFRRTTENAFMQQAAANRRDDRIGAPR